MEKDQRKHIVLVHGACLGAWSWYKVTDKLKKAGHKVTAIDLAASGTHPKQHNELRTISDYFQPLIEFLESLPAGKKVILVGHSMGGYSIAAAMEHFPEKISVAVFCAAFMPSPDLPVNDLAAESGKRGGSLLDTEFTFENETPTSFKFGSKFMKANLYQLSPREDLLLAKKLRRPHPAFGPEAMDIPLTKEKFGSVRRVYIVCDEDKAIEEDFQRWMIEKNPVEEVKVITKSDHLPMFSNPDKLANILDEIAQKY